MLVEVATRAADDGLEVTVLARGAAWRRTLTRDELSERERLLSAILGLRDDFDRSSYWHSEAAPRDRKLADLDSAYHELHAWDLHHIVRPMLALLERRFPGQHWVVVGEGRPGAPLFNVRGALRVGVLRGVIPPQALAELCCVHAWAGRGCLALAEFHEPSALPRFRGADIDLLIAPPRPEIAEYLQTLARGRDESFEELLLESLETDAPQVAGMLSRADWQARLLDELRATAGRLGAAVRVPASRDDLVRALAGGGPGRLVALIAHQDEAGVHLADGPVPLAALGELLLTLRERGVEPCGSVDLGVCRAEDDGNLAECFQAFGSPVVHTHGRYAHFGRTLGAWLWALRSLRSPAQACSLPTLLDGGWLEWRAAARVSGG